MEDKKLIELASNGDTAAFEELMSRYENRVYTMSLRMVINHDDAADITQETFIRVWKSLPRFRGNSQFSTWLYRIVSNLCADFGRRRARHTSIETLHIGDEPPDTPDVRFNPEYVLERHERSDAIRRAVDNLSPEHREVFIMREVYGLSYIEIAGTLDLEEGTVKSRLFRAREALRKDLRNFTEPSSSNSLKGGDEL